MKEGIILSIQTTRFTLIDMNTRIVSMRNMVLLWIAIMTGMAGFNCSRLNNPGDVIYLDELEFEEILDPYGPPFRKKSFAKEMININGNEFDRGLGVHAPSHLYIDLDGKAERFEAVIGMDATIELFNTVEGRNKIKDRADYSYDNKVDHYDFTKGGTAVFMIVVDGDSLFVSEKMTLTSDTVHIFVDLKDAKKMELIVDDTGDGSFADYANWADARLYMKDDIYKPKLYRYPQNVILNHVGYHTESPKYCYVHNSGLISFKVKNYDTQETEYEGDFQAKGGDLGEYLKGEFTDFKIPGKYYITNGASKSEVFEIRDDVFVNNLISHLQYITLQRSGHPDKGWAKHNHLDDGVRKDTGEYQDVTGGWYDACDIRKPAAGNAELLFALTHLLESKPAGISVEALIDEIRWGNKFLFAMQESAGYLMEYIGYTWKGYAENVWTDNIIGTEDDRTIITDPASMNTQLLYTISELKLSQLLHGYDDIYAEKCFNNAKACYDWIDETKLKYSSDCGLGIVASLLLYKITMKSEYLEGAEKYVKFIMGNFYNDDRNAIAYFNEVNQYGINQTTGFILYGLAHFCESLPEHALVTDIRDIVIQYTENYVNQFNVMNAFSILPWQFSKKKLGGERSLHGYYYKYFLHVGMNQHLARDAFGLLKIARILDLDIDKTIHGHYDWILGANPYNASTVTGLGYNQPDLFKTGAQEFKPYTPDLPGGVMTGIGGTADDKIALRPGWWWTTEYWSPTVMATMLLTNELNERYNVSID